jgi:hypothetical protein
MMMERGDFKVFHEPFTLAYYLVDKRGDPVGMVMDAIDPKAPRTWEDTINLILSEATKKPVFFKDMSYQGFYIPDKTFFDKILSTFIIRDPALTVLSAYKLNPKYTLEEQGFEAAYKLFKMAEEKTGKAPAVVDAMDLENDPAGIVKAYCEAVEIPFIPKALTWAQREPSEWRYWGEWHSDAIKSAGFTKSMEKFDVTLDSAPHLRDFYEISLPYYRLMYKHRVRAKK